MHHRVRFGMQKRRPLGEPGEKVKHPLPKATHRELLVRDVTMQKETMHEQRKEEVSNDT